MDGHPYVNTPELICVCLSGGLDSTTLLAHVLQAYPAAPETPDTPVKVVGVVFQYPSKHNEAERLMANVIASHYGIELFVINLTSLFATFNNAMTNKDKDIPEGHYTDATMADTVVPCRNVIFASCATALIMDRFPDCRRMWVALGVHAGDHPIYPDCRRSTLNGLAHALYAASERVVQVITPFVDVSKADIVKEGLALGVPYNLTRTCYTADEVACGKCGSCVERLEAFEMNSVPDPIPYNRE